MKDVISILVKKLNPVEQATGEEAFSRSSVVHGTGSAEASHWCIS